LGHGPVVIIPELSEEEQTKQNKNKNKKGQKEKQTKTKTKQNKTKQKHKTKQRKSKYNMYSDCLQIKGSTRVVSLLTKYDPSVQYITY
jgi:hypothetical protein